MTGLPGDTVEILEKQIFINQQIISEGFALTIKLNIPNDSFNKTLVLPKDYYWFSGETDESLDSRYFGPIKHSMIYGRAYPLW